MRFGKIIAALAATATLVLATGGIAAAEGNGTEVSNYQKLHLGGPYNGADNSPSTCGSIGWRDVGSNGDDSPIDSNDRALVATICPGDFAEAYSKASLAIDKPLANVKNISFDYLTSSITGAGQVYIGAVLSDGNVMYLDPTYCSKPIGVSSTWSRADFTGTKTAGACTVYTTDGVYTSDGTSTALQLYAAAHPGVQLSYTFLGFFPNGTGTATYVVDRIALGTNKLYNYSNTRAFGCSNTEARC